MVTVYIYVLYFIKIKEVKNIMLEKIKWYLKQLLPLTYTGKATTETGTQLCVWKMWFGKPFHMKFYELK